MIRIFSYKAVDSHGKQCRGRINAESRESAIAGLKKQGMFATSMDELSEDDIQHEAEGLQEIFDFFGFTFVSQKDMALYTRKFAGLINAGISYSEIFDVLEEESENRRLSRVSKKIAEEVRKGNPVFESLAKFPNVFPKVYRSMVNAGESTGRLDEIMNRLANMYESEHELRMSVMSKMYFPIIYLIVGMAIISFVIFFLPMIIQTAFPVFSKGMFLSVMTFWGTIIALILLGRTKPGYRIFRAIVAYIPPFGGLLRKMSLARFSRLLANMYSAGVPVMTGLDIAGETLMEPALVRGVENVKIEINKGTDLATALTKSNVFPQSLRGMVRTGEIAGNIDGMLNKAAEYYEIEIKTKSSMLSTIFTVVVMLLVYITFAIFIISAWSNYFGFINSFLEW
jgi:type II secretory pathway component PulF